MRKLTIEAVGSEGHGPCECCGASSRTVWGFVHDGGSARAAYFVHWTLGEVERHGANVDLIIGKWGDGAESKHRLAVSLEFQRTAAGPSFTVIDAFGRPAASSDLVGEALSRDEVIGTPLADQVFELLDAIWLRDRRISKLAAAD